MSDNQETSKVLLGILPARAAEILRGKLARSGIDIACMTNHSTCTTGCSPSMEVWAHPEDAHAIRDLIEKDRIKELESMGADLNLLDKVFDPTQPEATCPACGTQFATAKAECPECGLHFA
ncbi:MAG: hypothetical protein RIQ81_217 [Pseudomonadota bacterium]|jgi:rubrerythrin